MTILGRFYEKIEKTMIKKYHEKSRLIFFPLKSLFIHLTEFYADSNGEVYFIRSPLFLFIL